MENKEARKFIADFVHGGLHDDPKTAVKMFQDKVSGDAELQKIIGEFSGVSWREIAAYEVTDSKSYKRLLGEAFMIFDKFTRAEKSADKRL